MRQYVVPSMITALIVSCGLLTPATAAATVRIHGFGVDVCFTGKKNPQGCDAAKALNQHIKVVITDDATMDDLDKLQGKSITLENAAGSKTSGFEAEYSGATGGTLSKSGAMSSLDPRNLPVDAAAAGAQPANTFKQGGSDNK